MRIPCTLSFIAILFIYLFLPLLSFSVWKFNKATLFCTRAWKRYQFSLRKTCPLHRGQIICKESVQVVFNFLLMDQFLSCCRSLMRIAATEILASNYAFTTKQSEYTYRTRAKWPPSRIDHPLKNWLVK